MERGSRSRTSIWGALPCALGVRGACQGPPRGQPAPCPARSRGEPAVRASSPPASGDLSPRPLQLLQLLLLAAAGSAPNAPKRLGR